MGILLNSSIPMSLRCLLSCQRLTRTSSRREPAVSAYFLGLGPSLRAGHPCAIASPASCPAQEGELPILILQNNLPKAKQGGEEGVPPTSPAHHPASLHGINTNRCSRCACGSGKDYQYLPRHSRPDARYLTMDPSGSVSTRASLVHPLPAPPAIRPSLP